MSEFETAGWATDAWKPVTGQKTKVFFRPVQKKNDYKSKAQQRPVFEEVIHIVKVPADPKLRIDRPVREADKEEYPQEWAHWEKTRQSRVLGIPLDQWPALSETQQMQFKAMGVQTVEQFAALTDGFGQGIMGFAALREQAQVYLKMGQNAELIGQIRAESDARVSALEEKLAELTKLLEKQTDPEEATA